MAETTEFYLKEINKFIPCKEALYDILVEKKGYYLPPLASRAVSLEYLLNVARQKVFIIEKKKVEIMTIKSKITTAELADILKSETEKALGFINETLPPREWLINVIHA